MACLSNGKGVSYRVMATSRQSSRWFDYPLTRWLIGLAIALVLLHISIWLFFAPEPVIVGLEPSIPAFTWFIPAVYSFFTAIAASITFLSLTRYRVLRKPALFWTGMAFSFHALASFSVFLSWPGVGVDNRGLIAQLPNTSAWLSVINIILPSVTLQAVVFARWPRAGAPGERWWFWVWVASIAIIVLIATLLVTFEQFLPALVVDGNFTPLYISVFVFITIVLAIGTVLTTRCYHRTNDPFFGYLSLTELVWFFTFFDNATSPVRYSLLWYLGIGLLSGQLILLYGLLSEYVGLYLREQQRTRELEGLIETTPIAILFLTAPDGCPQLFNKAAEVILGRPVAPDVSITKRPAYYNLFQPNGEPLPPDEHPGSRALHGETVTGQEMLVRQPSGRQLNILASATPLRDASGTIVGAILAYQDITPIKEQERLRDEFLSAAAHELKTPVTTIKGYVQLMQKWTPQELEERKGRAFTTINNQTNRIGRRVQEMLEATRLRTAAPELHRVRFDLGELTSQIVNQMQATTRLHRLALKREGAVPVEADRERIEEVLESLVDNAIRLSPKGGDIEVRVWAQEGEAMVSVRDHGVGIPKDRQPHIFEPFYEAVPSGTPGYRGVVALSLSLSKFTVEQHGGRIWFESEEGKGSTFYFSLPLATGDNEGLEK